MKGQYLEEDKTTHQAWIEAGVDKGHIVGLGAEHNYWLQRKGVEEPGISQKCGPNTELFYDLGLEMACSSDCMPGCKCGRFVEFSNSLFICSEILKGDDRIRPLSNPFTETVIGAERVSMILQGARSVFDIAEFQPILRAIRRMHQSNLPVSMVSSSEKVIADHLRGLFCLVESGAPPPGKNGRERIVKTLIRRVITRLIALEISVEDSLPVLVETVVNSISESRKNQQTRKILLNYFHSQNNRFTNTISRGQRQLTQLLKDNQGSTLTGQQILYLEKSCGLPSLLTKLSLRKRGLAFAEAEYTTCLKSN